MTQLFVIPAAYPQAGEVLDGKYQIERLLGEGGMGAVAKATHLLRRAPVALKFMSPSVMMLGGAVERFINEGVAASQIDSDHVVKVYDVGQLPTGAPYLVMEYLEGQDLSDLLLREGTPGLPIVRAVHFTLQILRGLQIAHQANIVHRDMKPSNCFVVRKDGEDDFVKLLDFGISKVQHAGGGNITRTNSALGTPLYMSPEQARSPKDVDRRSDIFSVGVILYELLTGQTPFHSDSGEFTEILFKIFTQDPPYVGTLRPDLPEDLCAAIHKALARNPDDRYATAFEMAEGIAPWADERSTQVIVRSRAVQQGHMSQLPGPSEAAPTAAGVPPLVPMRPNFGQAAPEPPETQAAAAKSPQEFTAELPGARNAIAPSTAPVLAARQGTAPVRPNAAAPQLTMRLGQAVQSTDAGVSHEARPKETNRRAIVLVGAGALFISASIVAISAVKYRFGASPDALDAAPSVASEPTTSASVTAVAAPPSASVSVPRPTSSAPDASVRLVPSTSKSAHSTATTSTGIDRIPERP
jgi:serine/threonine-protein kinase